MTGETQRNISGGRSADGAIGRDGCSRPQECRRNMGRAGHHYGLRQDLHRDGNMPQAFLCRTYLRARIPLEAQDRLGSEPPNTEFARLSTVRCSARGPSLPRSFWRESPQTSGALSGWHLFWRAFLVPLICAYKHLSAWGNYTWPSERKPTTLRPVLELTPVGILFSTRPRTCSVWSRLQISAPTILLYCVTSCSMKKSGGFRSWRSRMLRTPKQWATCARNTQRSSATRLLDTGINSMRD